MKKRSWLWILITCFLVLAALSFDDESYTLNEEKYGNPYGRDYRGHVGDGMFQMVHCAGVDELVIAENSYALDVILSHEYNHKYDGHDLYFYSADGYAVVYAKSNLCKVLITDFPEELVTKNDRRYSNRKKENNYRIGKLEEFKCIVYIDSFDEFTEYEQDILNDLKEKKDREDKASDVLSEVLDRVFEFLEPVDEVNEKTYDAWGEALDRVLEQSDEGFESVEKVLEPLEEGLGPWEWLMSIIYVFYQYNRYISLVGSICRWFIL
ncbi:MAG: hypothetical protein J5844_01860 [Clostridia bacterium]|nr:hypothetical protein [Clostridia bacterium]